MSWDIIWPFLSKPHPPIILHANTLTHTQRYTHAYIQTPHTYIKAHIHTYNTCTSFMIYISGLYLTKSMLIFFFIILDGYFNSLWRSHKGETLQIQSLKLSVIVATIDFCFKKCLTCEMLSSGHDMAVVHMNWKQLWLHVQDLHKIKLVNIPVWIGKEIPHRLPVPKPRSYSN